ncbi:uncharacterized protein BDV17DRAFT_211099 [Aspergillus undulatus]|uniref:uncharacterized protein n=1 Tax=Aspergillus undulatus TaxID=1810928 RepID=UPI003CCDE12D
MRSGLRKPGTVPLLALVLFCLLSLVPTLAKEWDFYGYGAQLAYLGLSMPRNDGRYSSSRVKNASVETRPRLWTTSHDCKPWLFGDFYSSCVDLNAQPHYSSIRTPPRSSFEAGSEPEKGAAICSPTKEPSSITRGVSAFKEFVIRRWDDQQTIRILRPSHDPVDEASAQPAPTQADLSVTPAPQDGQQRHSTPAEDVDTAPPGELSNADSLLLRLPLLIHETWQHPENLITPSLIYQYFRTLIPKSPASAVNRDAQTHSIHPRLQEPQPDHTSDETPSLNDSNSTQDQPSTKLENLLTKLPPNTSTVTAGQSKHTGLTRDPEHMCGSSMAIVIALVAGIMWF